MFRKSAARRRRDGNDRPRPDLGDSLFVEIDVIRIYFTVVSAVEGQEKAVRVRGHFVDRDNPVAIAVRFLEPDDQTVFADRATIKWLAHRADEQAARACVTNRRG